MDPIAQVGADLMLFNAMYGNYGPPGALGAPFQPQLQPGQVPLHQAGYLVPAPEDPPLRPSVVLDTEHLLHRMEGLFAALFLILALVMRGVVLQMFWATLGVMAFYKYTTGRAEVARFYQEEQFRASGRLFPAPMPMHHYVVQNAIT
jgi:hypothetical protein